MRNVNQEQTMIGDLYIQSAGDPAGNLLGWAVNVLIDDGVRAEYLVLQHCIYRAEALCVKQGIFNYFETERHMLATLAYPTEVWEWIALVPKESDSWWIALERSNLTVFRNEQYPLSFCLEAWHPNLPASYSGWFEKYCGWNSP